MRLKNLDIFQTKTDCAPAKKRVELVRSVYNSQSQLIAAEIKCANDQRMRPNPLRNPEISFILFVLTWQTRSVQIEKLCAVKPDAFGAVGLDGINVFWQFDVCRENNVTAVTRR